MKKELLILFFLIATFHLYAKQETYLIDNEAWAKGNFIEIGINSIGVFGSNGLNKPNSFHANRFSPRFGFIANPKKDNWVDYDGDFFAPGNPEEGFTIQVGKNSYSNNNNNNKDSNVLQEIPGKIISNKTLKSSCYENIAQVVWEGSKENLKIKRFYNITENGLFIQMITSVKNKSNATKSEVFFMHNVDPDNNFTLSNSFETNSEILSQPSALNNVSLVKASQGASSGAGILDTDGSIINFFSNDSRARVTYGGFSNRNAKAIWSASSLNIENRVGIPLFDDVAISIAFNLGDILPGEEKNFVYYYSLKEIDENFNPQIINIITFSPSMCNSNDGKIQITGLEVNENYNISYKKNGIDFSNNFYLSNQNGLIEILNLKAGVYSNFFISSSLCSSEDEGEYLLESPQTPTFTLSVEEPTNNCQLNNGIIKISGLNINDDYLISYDFNGTNSLQVTYTSNEKGEINITNLSNGVYSSFNVEYKDNCSKTNTDTLLINNGLPVTVQNISEQFYCDNDFDAITTINLSYLDDIAIGSQDISNYIVTYHTSLENANNNTSISKTNYVTSGALTYKLFVKIKHKDFNCSDISEFRIKIDTPDNFLLTSNSLCLLSDLTIDPLFNIPKLETDLDELKNTILWYYEDSLLPFNSSSIKIDKGGLYKVTATNNSTGCSLTKELHVPASSAPKTPIINLESILFADNNIVKITVSGIGIYEYKMDHGDYQNSPIFQNVILGSHIFFIRDIYGCGEISIEKTIINYPRFFTPDNFEYNSRWNIIGSIELKNPIIKIFNRYGKLLKTLDQNSIGWDGMYNGRKMPSNSYWFILYYEDRNNLKKIFKGYFSLIR
jgi:gliding motility-associated-like protein